MFTSQRDLFGPLTMSQLGQFITGILSSVTGKYLFTPRWLNIDLRKVTLDMRQGQQATVHYPVPERRKVCQQIHSKIPVGQFRNILEITQALITSGRVCMMI